MGRELGWAILLMAGAPALAREPAPRQTLEVMADALQDTLQQADVAVARAAGDLGRTGLEGRSAHRRLASLCGELTWAVACSAVDDEGVLVSEAPGAFLGVEGRDLTGQAHVRRMLQTREPVLSELFQAVEGLEAVTLAHPVFDRDGDFLGSVSLVTRPASLIGYSLKTAFPRGLPDVHVAQVDGTLLYGRELTPPVDARLHWTTVELHGTAWRAAVVEALDGGDAPVATYAEPAVPIPAEVGLDALVALADGHLQAIVDDLELIAAQEDVRSGDWSRVEPSLRRVGARNVPGVYWFARPDGTYWSVDRGRASAKLSDRAYFPRVLEGETVLGELVIGKTVGRTEGVVAVPLRGDGGRVVGMIGASVFLDELSATLREEMGLAGTGVWFYAFDAQQRLALYPEPGRLFLTSGELGPEVEGWFDEMQAQGEGVIAYTYEGTPRTLVFRRSDLTGWTYALGYVGEREPGT